MVILPVQPKRDSSTLDPKLHLKEGNEKVNPADNSVLYLAPDFVGIPYTEVKFGFNRFFSKW